MKDFVGFLRALSDAGLEYVVIGGCAVGAYAMLRGESVYSDDLDLYVAPEDLQALLVWAQRNGIVVEKRPRPRALQVAVLRYGAQEVNILTESSGLPPFGAVALEAREFTIDVDGPLEVPLADPFALLSNKLAVARDKDIPHIAVLRAFIDEEIIDAFRRESNPRRRIAPAKRLLRTLGARELSDDLARRIMPLARLGSDFRFLANHASSAVAGELVAASPDELRSELQAIMHRKGTAGGAP